MVGIATKPVHHRPAVKLFAPQQTTGCRAKDQGVISAEARGTGIEILEAFLFALLQQLIKRSIERISLQLAGQPQINHPLPAAGDAHLPGAARAVAATTPSLALPLPLPRGHAELRARAPYVALLPPPLLLPVDIEEAAVLSKLHDYEDLRR